MSEARVVPQIETERASMGSKRARYTAYLKGVRKLEQKAKADKAGREKAARMGGMA